MSRVRRWMTWHPVPGASYQLAEQLRVEARHDPRVHIVRLFVDVDSGQITCISDADEREYVERWFSERGYPPAQLGEVKLEGDHASIHEVAMFQYIAPGEA